MAAISFLRAHPQIFRRDPLAWIGPRSEAEMVEIMAAKLRRMNALGSEADAIRALSSGPFRLGDVAALAGAALFEARQAAVATEMVRR
jgi:hypothetical protein